MKKIFVGIVTMGLVLAVSGTIVSARSAEPAARWQCAYAGFWRECCFADTDGDGVCDKAGSTCIYDDSDGDGVCDNYAEGRGRDNGFYGGCGRDYADTDGDGICDNYESGRCHGRGHGCGWSGRGNGSRGGHCR